MQSSFQIYNASAGSGKTYILAKSYLKLLIASKDPEAFKHILAITFTNKAVIEMKERIIGMLKQFSEKAILEQPNPMFNDICEELSIAPPELHQRSKTVLKHLIHNYAAFDISTIDGFTHRIIRTFAFDLKLPLNFEVELDQNRMLSEAVDLLISKAGEDQELTKVLVDFAIEKSDDDKSWDISYDLNKISKLLVSENDLPYINDLEDKTLEDFKSLKYTLLKMIKASEAAIITKAEYILNLIAEAGLQFDDFNRKSLPNHFLNLSQKRFNVKFDANWQQQLMDHQPLYPKRVTDDIAAVIDDIQPEIVTIYKDTKTEVFQYKFLRALHKNITPLSVLFAIKAELNAIKDEQNKILISEFNTIISNEIKDQPTPFIYERIGEKFKHYFIDEFQDTSILQWQNLIPLISNALEQEQFNEKGSLMLVGDAKQSIYRWRGGAAEQFIDLYNKTINPFNIEPGVLTLDTNYRSSKAIVDFNNGLFGFISGFLFKEEKYAKLYHDYSQQYFNEHDGYVSLNFLDFDPTDDKDDFYCNSILETITHCLDSGFEYNDLCVLIRYKKDGIAIANYLNANGIPISTSETLLIKNSSEVRFIVELLKLIIEPDNYESKINVLRYLASFSKIENTHDFYSTHIHLTIEELFINLKTFDIHINSKQLLQAPLYELVEIIIRGFKLVDTSNAYIEYFLDVVLEYTQAYVSDLADFLMYYEKKEDSLSIASPKAVNTVQIMTIHKAKGLEFPVVIFPYADLNIYKEVEPKEWVSINPELYHGFSYAFLNYNKDFEHYNSETAVIYNTHQSQLELDNINLLYVALTRASEQLFIISKNDTNPKLYSGILIDYLKITGQWQEGRLIYTMGTPEKTSVNDSTDDAEIVKSRFLSYAKETHNLKIITNSGYLWNTDQQFAIERGNLIHT
ncbi:MAG: UvrD-helicase domain-containing protein, partial [Bacteroidota bacterium]